MHENASEIKKTYNRNYKELMLNIDVWGFRSKELKLGFETLFNKKNEGFICYSGIPKQYTSKSNLRDFKSGIENFVYVGQLIERKYPSAIISAVVKALPNKNFHISYIGKGYKKKNLNDISAMLGVAKNISILGKIPRDQIISHLDNSDCFIMISRDEVFGLVYLEAMARGCITIGARNEGIDGVIRHGENGFLCEAGNIDELAKLLININSLSIKQLKEISKNAIETAKEMTDYKVAEKYLNSVINFKQKLK